MCSAWTRAAARGCVVAMSDFGSLPIIATEAVPACAVCGGTATREYARGYDYELRTCANEWVFVQCAACAHVWLNPRPALDTLGVIYPPHYYAYDYETRIGAVARWGKSVLDSRKLGSILARSGREPRTYIDIGCGSGRYLRAMAARGLARRDIHGLELDRRVVDTLAAEGFSVACERAETATIAPGSIDLATMFHVLEHVDAPDRVIARVATWLSPGGVVAIETPNLDSLDRRLFADRYWGGYHIPRHWHLFTEATLSQLLTNAGLEPIETLYQTGHSFWMYSMHHWLRYSGHPYPRLARVFDPFSNVVPLTAFTMFDVARATLGARTSAMLMLARRAT
jgi:2-polyprenyl-3-methyl-5-hydroxy-6-metoxy-1,4-benzoquinol methylase